MESFYVLSFVILAFSTCILEWLKSTSAPKPYHGNRSFLGFRDNYLMVYSLMMGATTAALETLEHCYICSPFVDRSDMLTRRSCLFPRRTLAYSLTLLALLRLR